MLIVQDKPLGFDLLIGIDTIQALGSVEIMPARNVLLGRGTEVCVAFYVEEPGFHVSFNNKKRTWTAG